MMCWWEISFKSKLVKFSVWMALFSRHPKCQQIRAQSREKVIKLRRKTGKQEKSVILSLFLVLRLWKVPVI